MQHVIPNFACLLYFFYLSVNLNTRFNSYANISRLWDSKLYFYRCFSLFAAIIRRTFGFRVVWLVFISCCVLFGFPRPLSVFVLAPGSSQLRLLVISHLFHIPPSTNWVSTVHFQVLLLRVQLCLLHFSSWLTLAAAVSNFISFAFIIEQNLLHFHKMIL